MQLFKDFVYCIYKGSCALTFNSHEDREKGKDTNRM